MRSLLTSVEGSKLEEMFGGKEEDLPILENGAIFVDRDPEPFLLMISFLRNDCQIPEIKDENLNQRFQLELKYWGIELPQPQLEELTEVYSKINHERISAIYAGVIEMSEKAGPFNIQAAIE